jgi:predicted flap endonuclease-1-like 5' DNA nuclease
MPAEGDYRERLSHAEVQLSATRTTLQRVASDLDFLRERVDGLLSRALKLEELVQRSERDVSELQSKAAEAESAGSFESRLVRAETAATAARVSGTALRHEFDEMRRLESARGSRLESIEDRLRRCEFDASGAAQQLAFEALEERVRRLETSFGAAGAQTRAPDEARTPPVAATPSSVAPESDGALIEVPGIGPKTATQLREAGVADRGALVALTPTLLEHVAKTLGIKPSRLRTWQARARETR